MNSFYTQHIIVTNRSKSLYIKNPNIFQKKFIARKRLRDIVKMQTLTISPCSKSRILRQKNVLIYAKSILTVQLSLWARQALQLQILVNFDEQVANTYLTQIGSISQLRIAHMVVSKVEFQKLQLRNSLSSSHIKIYIFKIGNCFRLY